MRLFKFTANIEREIMSNFDKFVQEVLEDQNRQEVKKLLDKNQSFPTRVAITLVSLRRRANLSQRALAQRTGWKQSYIARLESITNDQIPSMDTIAHFAMACEERVALHLYRKENNEFQLEDALAINDDEELIRYLEKISDD